MDMVEGCGDRFRALDRLLWNHTASILATVMNCHRDPKKSKTIKAEDLLPDDYREEKDKHLSASKLHGMKNMIQKENKRVDN